MQQVVDRSAELALDHQTGLSSPLKALIFPTTGVQIHHEIISLNS